MLIRDALKGLDPEKCVAHRYFDNEGAPVCPIAQAAVKQGYKSLEGKNLWECHPRAYLWANCLIPQSATMEFINKYDDLFGLYRYDKDGKTRAFNEALAAAEIKEKEFFDGLKKYETEVKESSEIKIEQEVSTDANSGVSEVCEPVQLQP